MRQVRHWSIRRCIPVERRSDGRLFVGNIEIVPAYDRPWRSQALSRSTLDALTTDGENKYDSAACVRFFGARLHRCSRCGEPFLGPGNVRICSDACRAQPPRKRPRLRMREVCSCLRCGAAMTATRSTRAFCSNACRQAAYRERRAPT
jgi:predicted nucleic acid-binding Zn ribbon protein